MWSSADCSRWRAPSMSVRTGPDSPESAAAPASSRDDGCAQLDDAAVQVHVLGHVPRACCAAPYRPALPHLAQPVAMPARPTRSASVAAAPRAARAPRRARPCPGASCVGRRAPLVTQIDKALGVEPEKGLADRAATDAKLGHQIGSISLWPGERTPRGSSAGSPRRRTSRPWCPLALHVRQPIAAADSLRGGISPNSSFNAGRARGAKTPVYCLGPRRLSKSISVAEFDRRPYSSGRATATSAYPWSSRSAKPPIM